MFRCLLSNLAGYDNLSWVDRIEKSKAVIKELKDKKQPGIRIRISLRKIFFII